VQSIELRNAFAFDCEDCGRENFVRSVVCEMSQEDREQLDMQNGFEFTNGQWVTAPEFVQCSFCKSEFRANDSED